MGEPVVNSSGVPIFMSEGDYIETTLMRALDCITFVNSLLSAPYLDIQSKGDGVYEINILIHIQQPKGESHGQPDEYGN
jgi:hypothetical protein